MVQPAIDVEKLARRYGRRWALADVTFQLAAGRVLMVAGRNGSGKSTLFRVLSTAIRPDHGAGKVGGYDVVHERADVRRISALLAHQSYLYESLTAKENLDVVARFLGRENDAEILERVGLAQRANDPVSTFSAGMRKRLSFARVLLQKPEVVFLDEPYGQLDPDGFRLVDAVVQELKARGATVLIATHQVERVGGYADGSIMLEGGRVVARD
ncbi:MAG TPA: heme ABC exporter ATP-binding protein CcmA [Thermoanaerobaculia bacterium]